MQKKSEHKEFIIGTENSIVEHLQFECPDKKFYPVAVQLTCMNMKVTTLMDIYNCLKGQGGKKSPSGKYHGRRRKMHSQNGGAGRLNNNLKFSAGYYVMELIQ